MIAPEIRVTRGPGMNITRHRFMRIMSRYARPDAMHHVLPFTYTATQRSRTPKRVWKPNLPLESIRLLLEMGIVPLTDHLETL